MKKKLLNFICLIFFIFVAILSIEFMRFEFLKKDIPIFVIDKKFCSKDSFACYNDEGVYNEEYYGIGFSTKLQYVLKDEKYVNNELNYYLNKRHFVLFYIFSL